MAVNKKYIIGIDIGGSKINAIVFNDGKVLKSAKILTPKNQREFFKGLEAVVGKMISGLNKKELVGIGCGVAGVLDSVKGVVLMADNLRILNGFNVKKWLSEKFDCEVRIDNDSRSFTRGEYLFGIGKGFKNIIGMTLGTGIGGGIIIDGKVFHGSFNSAGEIGHMIYNEMEVEDLIGVVNLKNIGFNDLLEVYKSAKSGDEKAEAFFKKLGEHLGIILANLINILDPEAIVIGGGIADAAKFFLPEARQTINKFIISPKSRKNIKILVGKIGENAGAIGAAALFLE